MSSGLSTSDIDRVLRSVKEDLQCQIQPMDTTITIERATHYIHEHLYDEHLTVAQLRDECQIRSNTFSRRFKYCHGCTPHTYIQRSRIEAAQCLLERGAEDLFRVAMCVGYARYRTFARNFKDHTGCSPSTYQKNQQEMTSEPVIDYVQQIEM